MQALFCMDVVQNDSNELLNLYCNCFPPPQKARPFFLTLVRGVTIAKDNIDRVIETFSNNWKISRMSGVDRNVLRVAVFEMLYCKDIPTKVSINEAIDVGKKFGTEESGAFINGILDTIRIAIEENKISADPKIEAILVENKTSCLLDAQTAEID
jgi:N utilization substance protein B